jgi:hypothetical protein
MKKLKFFTLMICSFSLMATSAFAAILDGSEPLLCSIIDVVECSPDRECINGEASSVNLPFFVKVDVEDKTIRVPQAEDDSRVTKIQSFFCRGRNMALKGRMMRLVGPCRSMRTMAG